MAERIVSPGVFTREKDLSFLPQGIAEIGAAIIGPTKKGPAFVPTVLFNFQQFEEMFGGLDQSYYVPFTTRAYLRSAGTVTIVRTLGLGGYSNDAIFIYASGSNNKGQLAVILAPNASNPTARFTSLNFFSVGGAITGSSPGSRTNCLIVSASVVSPVFSLDNSNTNYVSNVFSSDPLATKAGGIDSPFYVYKKFSEAGISADLSQSVSMSYGSLAHKEDYKEASTPYVLSQKLGGANATSLFKVKLRSHGETDTNKKFKLAILNVKAAGSVAGSDYGSFSVQVREIDQNTFKESDDVIIEQWDNLNLDTKSANYFARKIGDRYVTIDTQGKLTYNGDWPNMSKHIYVSDYDNVKAGGVPSLVPYGYASVIFPVLVGPDAADNYVPTASIVIAQDSPSMGATVYDSTVFHGFDFISKDNQQYLGPLATDAIAASNVSFSLDDMSGHASASTGDFGGSSIFSDGDEKVTLALSHVKQRKFVVPFQGGFEGSNPATTKNTGADISGTNQQGMDCSTATSSGSKAYEMAINSVSNQDEFDINMLGTPGLIYEYHSAPINKGMDMVKKRGDAFYVFDPTALNSGINSATTQVSSLDTNYAAVYYPWVKILDDSINMPTWVPPSVVIPGVFSQNDRVAHEWFAPAGLNRGGLNGVLEAKTRLTHAERDILYEDRVNPIASFPGQGVVVFGQKTLQAKPSALDRINVRRLLIRLKKFIASSSRYLVFENNTVALRNRFLNIVNPYLESVQSSQGLTAFRVVMDDTNNTPDVIDRNQLVGQIFIQPARSVEFIVLDFVVQPTGAAFPS